MFFKLFRKKKQEALRHTKQNRDEVLASALCGCCSCLSVFPPTQIANWSDEADPDKPHAATKRTAICPHCGDSMVIGDRSGHKITPAYLDSLRAHGRSG